MNTPDVITHIVNKCKIHGISFSQGEKCVHVMYTKLYDKLGWKISDYFGRNIFSSIFYDEKENTFFVVDTNNNILKYKSQENVIKHASQFFMKDIHKDLTTKR